MLLSIICILSLALANHAVPSMTGEFLTTSKINSLVRRNNLGNLSKNMKTVLKYFNATIYPNPLEFKINKTFPNDIWNPNTKGRVAGVLGVNEGDFAAAEYTMGLVPTNPSFGFYIRGYRVDRMFEDRVNNAAMVQVTADFYKPTTDQSVPVSYVLFVNFDNNNLITEYEIILVNIHQWEIETGRDPNNPAVRAAIKTSTCNNHQANCHGDNKQFASLSECLTFMDSIPFGNAYSTANSVTCRAHHSAMTPFTPEVHCAHVGPSGGGQCVDIPWTKYFDDFSQYSGTLNINTNMENFDFE